MVGRATLTMLKSNWSTNCAAQINASALTAVRRTIDCVEALMVPVLPITYHSALTLQSLVVSPGKFVPVDDIPPPGRTSGDSSGDAPRPLWYKHKQEAS